MSSQTTKTTLKLMEKTDFLVSSIETQKPTVNAKLGEVPPGVFTGAGEAPQEPEWDRLQDWNAAILAASAERVRRADRDHRLNLVQLSRLRQDRRDHVKELRSGHRNRRTSFTGTYGEDALSLVGLDAPPARAFLAVGEQIKESAGRMRDVRLVAQLPEPKSGQQPIDLEGLATVQDTEMEVYDDKTAAIQRMRKEADESLVVKREAQAEHRRIYANVARVQEGLYRMAGLDELADRIRVTEPAPRRKAEDGDSQPGEPSEAPEPAEQQEQREETSES